MELQLKNHCIVCKTCVQRCLAHLDRTFAHCHWTITICSLDGVSQVQKNDRSAVGPPAPDDDRDDAAACSVANTNWPCLEYHILPGQRLDSHIKLLHLHDAFLSLQCETIGGKASGT